MKNNLKPLNFNDSFNTFNKVDNKIISIDDR